MDVTQPSGVQRKLSLLREVHNKVDVGSVSHIDAVPLPCLGLGDPSGGLSVGAGVSSDSVDSGMSGIGDHGKLVIHEGCLDASKASDQQQQAAGDGLKSH